MRMSAALRGRIATAILPAAAARRWANGWSEMPMVSFSFPGALGHPGEQVFGLLCRSALTALRGGPRFGSARPDTDHLWCNLRRTLHDGSEDIQGVSRRLSLMASTFARRVCLQQSAAAASWWPWC